mgnify:CR=1 FL=1
MILESRSLTVSLGDAALVLALRLTGGLVAAVLGQVALGTRHGDLVRDFLTQLTFTMGELFLHLVVCFLRQQVDLVLSHIVLLNRCRC